MSILYSKLVFHITEFNGLVVPLVFDKFYACKRYDNLAQLIDCAKSAKINCA